MDKYDGSLIIGTDVDTTEFDKDIKNLDKKIDNNDSNVDIKPKLDSNELKKQLDDMDKKLKEYSDRVVNIYKNNPTHQPVFKDDFTDEERIAFQELSNQREELYSKYVESLGLLKGIYDVVEKTTNKEVENVSKTNVVLSEQTQKYNELIGLLEEYKLLSKEPVKSNEDIQNLEILKQKIIETKHELESLTGQKFTIAGFEQYGIELDNIGTKLKSVTKKVGRWALALFGVRTAYSFIRQMTSQAIQQNEELANKMQYIKSALGSAFQPIAKVIVDIIYRLLAGIGALIKLITGKNIFKNVNTDLKNANKNAKALQKTLAGWDEATVLGSNSNLANGLLGSGLNIADDVEKVSKKIKKWFTKPLTKEDIMKVVNSYIGAFELGYNWLKENIFNPGIGYIKQMIQETEPLWGPVWYKMKETFIPAIEIMKQEWSKFKDFLQPAKDFFNKLFEPATKAWNDMVENYLKPAWFSFYNSLPQPVQDALNKIWTKFKELYNDIAFYLNNIGIHVAYITDTTETEVGETTKKVKQNVGEISSQVNKLSGAKINITTNTSSINKLKDILDEIVYNVQILTGKNVITTTTWTTKANPKSAKGSIIYPKLAVGGIVNMPGRGVPYHGATIGERGAEAIVPLTDSQQMQLLGEAIGKYITINATIPVYAYNRQVDRQIQKIQNQQDFAMNR